MLSLIWKLPIIRVNGRFSDLVRVYLVPGFVFQSIIIGGGYGTGRELVQFFLSQGPLAGILGIFVAMAVWSLIISLSFEISRATQSFDYSSFITRILGPFAIIYEISFVISAVLIISVIGSASGELAGLSLGIESIYGIVIMMLVVATLSFFGTTAIERFLSVWSVALYMVYIAVVLVTLYRYFPEIGNSFRQGSPIHNQWLFSGIKYSCLNVAILPAVLFVARHFRSRKEALISGMLAGPIAMFPAIFIYLSMLSRYPGITEAAIPTNVLFEFLDIPVISAFFQLILFGTFIETGVGLIHGINERIAGVYESRGRVFPGKFRLYVSVAILVICVFVADLVGIIDLIAKGYDTMAWVMILVYVLPVLFAGTRKLWFAKG